MKKIKNYQLWESEESQRKLDQRDLDHACEWAKKYGYEVDRNLGVDVVIKGLVERHNTFLRGKKKLSDIQNRATTVPPNDVADVQLSGKDILTKDGELGLLFCTNKMIDARGYGHVAFVRRHIFFDGPRNKWLEKNDFDVFLFDETADEEDQIKRFEEASNQKDHLVMKSPAGHHDIIHYIFRGKIGEKLMDFIGMAEGDTEDIDSKISKR